MKTKNFNELAKKLLTPEELREVREEATKEAAELKSKQHCAECIVCKTSFERKDDDLFPLCSELCAIKKYTSGSNHIDACWIDYDSEVDSYGDGHMVRFQGHNRNLEGIAFDAAFEMLDYNNDFDDDANLGWSDLACYRLNNRCRNPHHYKRLNEKEEQFLFINPDIIKEVLKAILDKTIERYATCVASCIEEESGSRHPRVSLNEIYKIYHDMTIPFNPKIHLEYHNLMWHNSNKERQKAIEKARKHSESSGKSSKRK